MINMLFKRNKPGIFTRLNHIIIIQVIFVFAALAIVLFYPSDNTSLSNEKEQVTSKLDYLIGQLQKYQANNLPLSAIQDSLTFYTKQNFDENPLSQLAILTKIDSEEIAPFFVYRQDQSYDSYNLTTGIDGLVSFNSIKEKLLSEHTEPVMVIPDATHLVFYTFFTADDNTPAVIVSIFEHQLLLTNKSNILYYFVILFQAALLVSLLLIYLINSRFIKPLNRLIRNFEKKSDGGICKIDESHNDKELSKLSEVFNQMSQVIYDKEHKLKSNVSELNVANNSLKESQEFLGQIIECSPSSIITTNPTGEIKVFNKKASEEFKIDYIDAIGQNINELFTHPVEELILSQSEKSDDNVIEVLGRRGDGSFFPAYLVAAPVFDNQGQLMAHLYFIRDISESKGFQDMMIRLDRYSTKGKMAGDIAHEINNFLTILLGNLDLLPILLMKNDQDKFKSKVDVMRSTLERISNFTGGLMEIGDSDSEFMKRDINQSIQTVVTFLQPQNKYDGIEIKTELAIDIPLVEFDQGKLQQVLVNLINNSAEASLNDDSVKQITISTSLVLSHENPGVKISVADNGKGVDEENIGNLFNKRFTTKRKGHGIGLITCSKLIQAHQGEISYLYDNGALFEITLPINQPDNTVSITKAENEVISEAEPSS